MVVRVRRTRLQVRLRRQAHSQLYRIELNYVQRQFNWLQRNGHVSLSFSIRAVSCSVRYGNVL